MMNDITELFDIFNDSGCLLDVEKMAKKVIVFVFVKPCANGRDKGIPSHRIDRVMQGLEPKSSRAVRRMEAK
jgi:hypothetical protein